MSELMPCPFCGFPSPIAESGDKACVVCYGCGTTGPEYREAVDAEYAWNRRAPAWIPTSERLPESRRRVLCSWRGVMDVAFWSSVAGGVQWYTSFSTIEPPDCWQPLPAPPEDKT